MKEEDENKEEDRDEEEEEGTDSDDEELERLYGIGKNTKVKKTKEANNNFDNQEVANSKNQDAQKKTTKKKWEKK